MTIIIMAMSLRKTCLSYDEDFNRKLKIAKFLVNNLRERKETLLGKKWLVRVSNIKSPVLEVKKNRNAFLSYMIKVLGDGVLTARINSEGDGSTLRDPDDSFLEKLEKLEKSDVRVFSSVESTEETRPEEPEKSNKMHFHWRWSNDRRTYVAVKPIPGRGALLYLASSRNSGLRNWDLPTKNQTAKNSL